MELPVAKMLHWFYNKVFIQGLTNETGSVTGSRLGRFLNFTTLIL